MATVLPVVNNESSEIVEILQREIDENIARENEQQEMMEEQTGLLKNQNFMINLATEHLESIRSTISNMFDLMSSSREDEVQAQETGAIRADITEERGTGFDSSGSVRGDTDLFDMSNLDSGMIGNILGGAVLAYIYGVDDIIQGAVGLLNPGVYIDAARGLLNRMILKPIDSLSISIKNSRLVREVQRMIDGPMQVIQRVMLTFSRGMNAFIRGMRTITGPIGTFVRSLKNLPILGRLLGPFGVLIFGIVDFISGFIDGFKEEGSVYQGLKEGMSELLAGIVGVPLDMLKNMTAWVTRKFGWENISKELEEFSFSKMVKDTFDGLIAFFEGLFANPVQTLRGLVFGEDGDKETATTELEAQEPQTRRQKSLAATDEWDWVPGKGLVRVETKQSEPEIENDEGLRETGKQVGQQSEEQAVNRQSGGISGATVVAPSDNSTNIQNSSKVTYQGHPAARPSDHSYKELQRGWLWW